MISNSHSKIYKKYFNGLGRSLVEYLAKSWSSTFVHNLFKVVYAWNKNKTAQSSLVLNAWANQMSIKIGSVPNCVFVPTGWACSLISSFKDITWFALTLKVLCPFCRPKLCESVIISKRMIIKDFSGSEKVRNLLLVK